MGGWKILGQAAQDEDEDYQRHRLHQHLRQCQVRRAIELVQERNTVSRYAQQKDSLEAMPGAGTEECGQYRHDADKRLGHRIIRPQTHLLRPIAKSDRGRHCKRGERKIVER